MYLLFPYSDGIKGPSDVTTVKFDGIVNTLKTGDLVLFSGATTSGALIKLFDNAEFSHIGLVSFAISTILVLNLFGIAKHTHTHKLCAFMHAHLCACACTHTHTHTHSLVVL